jgi:hypothetical protein
MVSPDLPDFTGGIRAWVVSAQLSARKPVHQKFSPRFDFSSLHSVCTFAATDGGFRFSDIVALQVNQQKLVPIFPELKIQIQSPPHVRVFVFCQ